MLDAKTWVSRFRRRTLSTRELRVRTGGEAVAAATQEWVHVDFDTLKPKQGSLELAAAFPETDIEPSVKMPEFDERCPERGRVRFDMWQTWADPLAHANHPAYVDWCDEATQPAMSAAGLDPVLLRPSPNGYVSERRPARRGGARADEAYRCHRFRRSRAAAQHRDRTGSGGRGVTVRGLADGSAQPLIAAWA